MQAIIQSRVRYCFSPSYNKTEPRKKSRDWKKFMDSLDWDKISKKHEKPDPKVLKSVFMGFGIPVKKKGV